jgi:hypothetical protein
MAGPWPKLNHPLLQTLRQHISNVYNRFLKCFEFGQVVKKKRYSRYEVKQSGVCVRSTKTQESFDSEMQGQQLTDFWLY